MDQWIKGMIKDAVMSISAGIVYAAISYFSEGTIDIKAISCAVILLFIVWRSMRRIAPRLK